MNRERLVEMAVVGHIRQPTLADPPYRVAPDGTVRSLPGTSSITYNFRVGESAVDMAGDHVEPAVSITTEPTPEQRGLNVYAQIGNAARVVSGEARGAEGVVIGKHGGIENVMVEFPDEVYDDLVIGDRIQIRAIGLGMEATNVEGVAIRNLSPDLLAVTIGVVVDGISRVAGHGPGVTTLLTSATGNIEPVLDSQANLATLLGLR